MRGQACGEGCFLVQFARHVQIIATRESSYFPRGRGFGEAVLPGRVIIDTAKAKGRDLITMASHGCRGVPAIVLGSETVKVLTHSKIPVLVHR